MATKQESRYWMESKGDHKRLASNHFIAKAAMAGKLVVAPVDFSRPVKVLDSGTADGTWLLDLASSLPTLSIGSHEFVGTDLNAAHFPQSPPPNVTFMVQDIKNAWPASQHNSFELVHQRLTLLGAGSNPSASIAHLYSLVKPGGWIQISEGTMDFPSDVVNDERTPAYCDLLRLMRCVAGMVGAEWHLGRLRDATLAKEGAESCGVAVQG